MKRLFSLFFIFFIITNFGYTQKLTINDLINLCSKKNWADVDNVLISKGWSYYQSKKGDSFNYNTITWSFKKAYDSDKAAGWLHLYTYEGYPNKISYNFFNKESFSFIQNSITSSGFKLTDSNINDDMVVKNFSNNQFILTISTTKSESGYWDDASITSYIINIVKKSSVYDVNNGKKIIYYPNGNLFTEYTLKNGKNDGPCKFYYENGNLMKTGFFSNDIPNGVTKEYDENGNIEFEYVMVKGIMDGAFKLFYPDGKIKKTGVIKNGKQNGKQIEYYPNGKIQNSYIKKNDSLDGPFLYYSENGVLNISSNYKNGYLHGAFILFDENGNKIIEINYVDGLKNGLQLTYNNGILASKTHFVNDIKHGPFYSIECLDDNSECYTTKFNYVNDTIDGYMEIAIVEKNKDAITIQFCNYTMGVLNGSFQSFSNDTIEVGNYKNGVLDGEYWLYYGSLPFYINENTLSEIKSQMLKEHGVYKNGLKHGFWKNYTFLFVYEAPSLVSCGNYVANEKDGEWYYYRLLNSGLIDGNIPPKENVLEILNYKNGKLDGKSTSFFTFESHLVPCTDILESKNSNDSCFNYKVVHEKTIAHYKNDKLNGHFEVIDSLGLKTKGFYKDNIKVNEWVEREIKYDFVNNPQLSFHHGKYNNGFKDDFWYNLNKKGDTVFSANYSNNNLHGEYIIFHNNIRKIKINYLIGAVYSITIFDSIGDKPVLLYDSFDVKHEFFFCKRTAFFDNYIESQEYVILSNDEINYSSFYNFFESLLKNSKYYDIIFKEGFYTKTLNDNKPLIKGLYGFDLKIETWQYFYYDQGVKKEVFYNNDTIISETFYNLDNTYFSGVFNFIDNDTNEKQIIKIKNGLRHGTTSCYDITSNKRLSREKYRNGLLKK